MWAHDFPALQQMVHGHRLAFLDTAASAQKPKAVLTALHDALSGPYANVHRGLYHHSQVTTAAFEAVRAKVARFLGAPSENGIVFTRNTTDAINMVAAAWGGAHIGAGDEILLTQMEHHANLVPWQMLAARVGATLKFIPVRDDGALDLDAIERLMTQRTKLAAFTQVSNAIGTINPVTDMMARIRAINPDCRILVDGSQSAVHGPVDVAAMGCDWFVCTAHKIYGPNGVGVLYGKMERLQEMPPYQGGGDMIDTVTLEGATYKAPPHRFEAGTPAIAEVIAFGAALDYLTAIGWDKIAEREAEVAAHLNDALTVFPDVKLLAKEAPRVPIASFTMTDMHTADVAMILDQCGVAVRTGHHCCMPLMKRFGIDGTIRASIGLYSTREDVDQLANALMKARKMLTK